MRLRICLIVNLSSIVFAPYHVDLQSLLFLLDPAHEYLLPDCFVRVEKIRTSPFLTLACPFFFCSPMKRSVKGEGERKERKKERVIKGEGREKSLAPTLRQGVEGNESRTNTFECRALSFLRWALFVLSGS